MSEAAGLLLIDIQAGIDALAPGARNTPGTEWAAGAAHRTALGHFSGGFAELRPVGETVGA